MKIYMDNELENFKKIVYIQSDYNTNIMDDINTIIDALHAYGYSQEAIETGLLQKCYQLGLITMSENDEGEL